MNLRNLTNIGGWKPCIVDNKKGEVSSIEKIVFPRLHDIKLFELDNLTCCCKGGYAVEYPYMENVKIVSCSKMEIFGHGAQMTHNLKKVHVKDPGDEGIWKGDLNATVQHIFNQKGFAPSRKARPHGLILRRNSPPSDRFTATYPVCPVPFAMEDTQSVATLIDSTTSKIQQLQKAFAELESHRAVTLNLKWKQLEEHFHGLEKSLKRRFTELEDQEKEYETKTIKAREMLEKREAAVMAKEHTSLERLQEKRNAAVSAIANAFQKHRKVSFPEPVVVSSEDQGGAPIVEEKPPDAMTTENNFKDMRKYSANEIPEVKAYPQLVKLCQEMDSEGLHKFISDNRKSLATVREEIPTALKAAGDPASLILDSLKGFYSLEVSNLDGKKDPNLLGLRRTCIMLMECLSVLLTSLDPSFVSNVITGNIKERAKAIAEDWKPKLDDLDVDASNGNSLEAHAFLQLLATFGIDSDFDQVDLSKLIPMVSRRRQTADLCRSLGLSEKMPGVINVLVNNGRQIDAVNLAFAFELTEQFSPLSLLKSYLTEARKNSSAVKSGNTSSTVQNEVNERELTALKAVIKCIEDHKLEEQYPVDPLQKLVLQLEKAKADSKRATEVAKPQPKRPRANGVGHAPRVTNFSADKNFYARVTDRYPQYIYDKPYVYHGHTDAHVPLLGSATYTVPPGHGNFFGNGFQYQATYLH
ncbi:FRIGIDA-like protein [Actinidia rufa]|uniref:FRIGIDA-like protein n=1 Tax=Actinidia rufa TaxID=165716 RepID=A0A7J0HAA0_9ERIC|nr:FRIGIDA-like protein [Actinidia rufa]